MRSVGPRCACRCGFGGSGAQTPPVSISAKDFGPIWIGFASVNVDMNTGLGWATHAGLSYKFGMGSGVSVALGSD